MLNLRDSFITAACRLVSVPFSLFAPSLPANRHFSSLVVLKPCCIGDVTLATAAVAALRQAYPAAHLAFVVGDWAKEAIRHNPHIDEIIDCGRLGSGSGYSRQEYFSLVRRLSQGKFELAVVLERSPLLSLIPFLAGVPHRAGINSAGRGFSLTVKAPWHHPRHEAELYLDVVRALGLDPTGFRAEFYPSAVDVETAEELLAEALLGQDAKLAMIHPGGAANPGMVLSAKRWLPGRFVEVARRLIREGWTVLIVGAESDRPMAETLRIGLNGEGAINGSARVIDLVGKLSLGEFGAVAQCCQLFVGNDTGPMHIAAATGTPTVAIFGPSTPEMYAPFGPRTRVVYNQVDCSPCFVRGRFNYACQDFKCMQAVEVEDVWRAIQQVLE